MRSARGQLGEDDQSRRLSRPEQDTFYPSLLASSPPPLIAALAGAWMPCQGSDAPATNPSPLPGRLWAPALLERMCGNRRALVTGEGAEKALPARPVKGPVGKPANNCRPEDPEGGSLSPRWRQDLCSCGRVLGRVARCTVAGLPSQGAALGRKGRAEPGQPSELGDAASQRRDGLAPASRPELQLGSLVCSAPSACGSRLVATPVSCSKPTLFFANQVHLRAWAADSAGTKRRLGNSLTSSL